ncbi:MAG: glycosyltransferase family protein [Chloroflexi bacterium]|nr:glycosyltransferase family protein [Chloroflexota bacterium]
MLPSTDRIVGIVQARMNSKRLPGKVLKDIVGEPMLGRVLSRSRRAARIDHIIVATSTAEADDSIASWCDASGWDCFRGDEADVLDRFYRAATKYQASLVVRITADNPLLDPEIIDRVIDAFFAHAPLDYASNRLPPHTFPQGTEIDVLTFEALAHAWLEDDNHALREHVTPYVYRHPERFRILNVSDTVDRSWMRWTVDTAEDLAFVRRVYEHFGRDTFSWRELLDVLEKNPHWSEINGAVRDVTPRALLDGV